MFVLAEQTMAVFELDAITTVIIVGTVLPLLVGIVTKIKAPDWLRAVLLLLFSAVTGLVTTATQMDGTAVFSTQAFILAAVTFLQSVALHFGFWRPTTVTSKVNNATAGIGIGGSSPPPQ